MGTRARTRDNVACNMVKQQLKQLTFHSLTKKKRDNVEGKEASGQTDYQSGECSLYGHDSCYRDESDSESDSDSTNTLSDASVDDSY